MPDLQPERQWRHEWQRYTGVVRGAAAGATAREPAAIATARMRVLTTLAPTGPWKKR